MKEKLIGLLELKLWFSEGTLCAASIYTATFIVHMFLIYLFLRIKKLRVTTNCDYSMS